MRMFQVKDDHGNSTLWYGTVAEARRAAFDQEMPITAEVREMCIGGKTDLIKTIKNFVNGDHTIEGFIKTTRNLGSVEQVKKAKDKLELMKQFYQDQIKPIDTNLPNLSVEIITLD